METEILSFREIILLAAFVVVRDGIPWLMRTAFPQWQRDRRAKDESQIKSEQAIRERELQLKREISDRDQIILNRQTRAIEAIEKNTTALNDSLAAQSIQLNNIAHSVTALQQDQSRYFSEGRQAIKQIAVLSAKPKAKK